VSHYSSEASDLDRVNMILSLLKSCEFLDTHSKRYREIQATVETWQKLLQGLTESQWRHGHTEN
jgi:hypothetical protein